MNVNVKEISVPYEFKLPSGRVLYRVEEVRLSYEQFIGSTGSDVTRVNFERGDAVGALLYEEETGKVILVKKFRYPVYARYAQKGWMLEIVAGIKDDEGRVVARKKILEETGLEPTSPFEHLTDFYVSPGETSERVELYLARVQKTGSFQENTGIAAESEDIRTPFPLLKHSRWWKMDESKTEDHPRAADAQAAPRLVSISISVTILSTGLPTHFRAVARAGPRSPLRQSAFRSGSDLPPSA